MAWAGPIAFCLLAAASTRVSLLARPIRNNHGIPATAPQLAALALVLRSCAEETPTLFLDQLQSRNRLIVFGVPTVVDRVMGIVENNPRFPQHSAHLPIIDVHVPVTAACR